MQQLFSSGICALSAPHIVKRWWACTCTDVYSRSRTRLQAAKFSCKTDLWGIDLALNSKTCIALMYTLLLIYAECFSWPNAVLLKTFGVLLLSDTSTTYTEATATWYVQAQGPMPRDPSAQIASCCL